MNTHYTTDPELAKIQEDRDFEQYFLQSHGNKARLLLEKAKPIEGQVPEGATLWSNKVIEECEWFVKWEDGERREAEAREQMHTDTRDDVSEILELGTRIRD